MTETTLIASADKEANTFAYRAIETLLKGPEIGLPVGYNFLDPHRNQRQQIRLRWWNTSGKTYRDLAEGREDIKAPNSSLPSPSRTGLQSLGGSASSLFWPLLANQRTTLQ